MTSKNERRGWPEERFAPANVCIYCGDRSSRLSDEHIVATALGCHWVLPKASCQKCATITSGLELKAARGFLLPVRKKFGLKSRKRNIPEIIPLLNKQGKRIELPFEDRPIAIALPNLPPPRIFTGDKYQQGEICKWVGSGFRHENFSKIPGGMMQLDRVDWPAFYRMLAKCAHADVYKYVRDDPQVNYLLKNYILNDGDVDFMHIGGAGLPKEKFPSSQGLHEMSLNIRAHRALRYIVTEVRLFANIGMPPFHVVVAQVGDNYLFQDRSKTG